MGAETVCGKGDGIRVAERENLKRTFDGYLLSAY